MTMEALFISDLEAITSDLKNDMGFPITHDVEVVPDADTSLKSSFSSTCASSSTANAPIQVEATCTDASTTSTAGRANRKSGGVVTNKLGGDAVTNTVGGGTVTNTAAPQMPCWYDTNGRQLDNDQPDPWR